MYSFGVFLLELISGCEALGRNHSDVQENLVSQVNVPVILVVSSSWKVLFLVVAQLFFNYVLCLYITRLFLFGLATITRSFLKST